MSETATITKQTRRRNVVSVSLTDEQMAQAVVLGLAPEGYVGVAVDAHTAVLRDRMRGATTLLPSAPTGRPDFMT